MSGRKWVQLAIFHLVVLATLGALLRYKIAFPLPFPDQKHLLHSHSHFAFTGWVAQLLMPLLIAAVGRWKGTDLFPRYTWLLRTNAISAWGMLVFFLIQGYGPFSIFFSTLSILVAYVFAAFLWKDMRSADRGPARLLFRSGLIYLVLSSAGTFALATMMVTKTIHQNWYLAAIYFFLHFQYNGWFILSCLGLSFDFLRRQGIDRPVLLPIARTFVIACLPAYFLSTLWMELPLWVYCLVVAAAAAQAVAWTVLIIQQRALREAMYANIDQKVRWVIALSAIAFTIKLVLQLGSTVPAMSTLAFGFRPIVIGYLHLVLLGVVSLFLLGYAMNEGWIQKGPRRHLGIWTFITGIILNEVLLMVQGTAAIAYVVVPFINEALFAAACTMMAGAALLFASCVRTSVQ